MKESVCLIQMTVGNNGCTKDAVLKRIFTRKIESKFSSGYFINVEEVYSRPFRIRI